MGWQDGTPVEPTAPTGKQPAWMQGTPVDAPAQTARNPNAGLAGIANLGASIIGLPMDTVQNVANLGIAAYGTAKQALTGKPGPDIIQNIPGGSERVKGMLRYTGIHALNPDNPNPNDKFGSTAYDFASRGGAIPGGALSAVGSIVAEKIGGPQWAGVGAMAPSAATMAFNAARAPGLAEKQAQNRVRDSTLKVAQDAGYVAPMSDVNPSATANTIESFAGKAPLRQATEIKNQQVTNKLVRQELNAPNLDVHVPKTFEITSPALDKLREQASQPYRELAAIDPEAAATLQKLKEVRQTAKDNFRHADMTGDPTSLKTARSAKAEASGLESQLESMATNAGKPELVPLLRESRQYIAKTYDVERAMNVGNGNVDAHALGSMLDRSKPLSGNLEAIAKFAEAFPRATREASKVPAPGVSTMNWLGAAGLGLEGYRAFGPEGLALAAVPFVRGGVRSAVLSDMMQKRFNRPDYTPNVLPQSVGQMAGQQAIIANQRKQ